MQKAPDSQNYTFANLVELFKQGKFTEVLRIAQPMIDQNPNEINLINIFGAAAAISGQFLLAEDYLKRALEIDKGNPELHNNMGNVLLQQKKYHQSVSHFKQAVEARPDNCKFYSGLGIALMSIDRINDAEKVLKTAVSLEPKNPETHSNMGALFWEKGNIKDSQKSCLRALSFMPDHQKAKLMMIRTFEAHNPDQGVNFPTVLANREIRKINLEKDIKKRLESDNISRILEQADNILAQYDPTLDYPESQTYRRNQTRLNCHRHEQIFHEHNIIPKFCFGCFKVQIEPRTVVELIKLFLLFDWIALEGNNSRKCIVELRDGVSGFYKALIFCSSLDEAKLIQNTISTYVTDLIDPNVPCLIKRGCSEFSISYPKYGRVDNAVTDGLMVYPDEWESIENNHDDQYQSDRSPFGLPTLRGFSLSDFLIIKNWIGYATGIGDTSVDVLSIKQIGSNRLLKAAEKRRSKLMPTSRSAGIKSSGYNIKPINIS